MHVANPHSQRQESFADKAFRILENRIIGLQLQPGQLLTEKDLIELTGIGRTPVREAAQRLAVAGLLLVLPRKGLLVAPLRRSDLVNILEARRVLERLVAVKAAERATVEQRRALHVLATHLDAAGDAAPGVLLLGARLDELLEAACQNPFLAGSLQATRGQCRRLWQMQSGELDVAQLKRLCGGLARSAADGDCTGAVRARNGIIAVLEGLAGQLDLLG